jgi:peptide-methionine (R)-S-oxide reductase
MKRSFKFAAAGLVFALTVGAFYFGITSSSSSTSHAEERIPLKIGTPKDGRVEKSDEEWRAILSPEAYRITRGRGTELACSASGWNSKADGYYECIACGQKLFDSAAKYESGTGWPSFFKPVDDDSLSLYLDRSPFGKRTEVVCSRCDAHLGHVFDDGPKPTGQRFCMNMGAMKFVPR